MTGKGRPRGDIAADETGATVARHSALRRSH